MTIDRDQPAPITLRAAAAVPPAAVMAAGLGLIPRSVQAWGAAANSSYPDWLPTLIGTLAGASAALIGGWCLLSLLERSKYPVNLLPARLLTALAMLAPFLFVLVALLVRIPDADSYRVRDPGEGIASAGAVTFSLVATAIGAGILYLAMTLYQTAFESNRGKRFEHRADEPDAMGALIADDAGHPGREQ